MIDLHLAWRSFRDHWFERDQLLIWGVLTLMTTSLLLVAMISSGIQAQLEANLRNMLGADVVITDYQALSEGQKATLEEQANHLSEVRLLDINLSHGERWQRVQLKVVDAHYPVQGELQVAASPGALPDSLLHGPAPGDIWLDDRVFTQLGLAVGQTLQLGQVSLTVAGILTHEPDRLMEGHSVAMRAMVSRDSLRDSALDYQADRWRYLIAADEAKRSNIGDWLDTTLPEASLADRHRGDHPLAGFWRRVENFLGLSSILLFILAATAIHMGVRRQQASRQRRYALYNCLGVGRTRNMRLALMEWVFTFAGAALPGVVCAWLLQGVAVSALQELFPGLAWGIHPAAVTKGLALILGLFLCLQIPVFHGLWRTSSTALFHTESGSGNLPGRALWIAVTVTFMAAAYSDNPLLTAMLLAALGATTTLLLGATWGTVRAAEFVSRQRSGLLPLALHIMRHRIVSKCGQVLGLGLCATLLLFTLMLMRDIGNAMFEQSRQHDGNLMVSEATAEHLPVLTNWAQSTGSQIRTMRRFQRAQLVTINGQNPADHAGHPSESLSVVEEQIRLSWSAEIPANNRLTAGQWWTSGSENSHQISVEEEVMVDLSLSLGDVLSFRFADREIDFTVVASHAFKPGASSVTFWFVIPEAAHVLLPQSNSVMGSMELTDTAWQQLASLLAEHPTLAVVPLRELTERFDRTLALVTKLAASYSALILLLSVAVLFASTVGFEADDRRRFALLRSLGLRDKDCIRLSIWEWLLTGFLAGAGAFFGTWLAGLLIYQSQFQMNYQPNTAWMLATLSVCCLLATALGVGFSQQSLNTSPRTLLAQ